ncbi:hypothetical protein [Streptomyces sp. NPDC088254]|uniref:hypothetical protein n=1 Tax=Streptomyces sp. NPDC088254 TaxID=3365847 RepID=UPI00382D6C5F
MFLFATVTDPIGGGRRPGAGPGARAGPASTGFQAVGPDRPGVNSLGRVAAGGHGYLVAVLSDGSATQAGGITLVEAAARAAVSAFLPA